MQSATAANFHAPVLNRSLLPDQDFPIKTEWIMNLWQLRKCTQEDALRELLNSRAKGSLQAMDVIKLTSTLERMQGCHKDMTEVQKALFANLKCFRSHPTIDIFLAQFRPETWSKQLRFRCLGLFGNSRSGKSCKALSLFGPEATLKVNCQGLPTGAIPSIARFDRSVHRCILWDEVRPDQVLGNKEVFQSGPWPVTLGQSVCNQHSYQVWLYHTAHILCSNDFRMTTAEGASQEDADWLTQNLYIATLPVGERWFSGTFLP